ncbi:NAD(P)-binding protein [Thozetella sp. PMI_491]|nr:NAD(P)-binding protein [Thozetella sp. PMI_491]
MAPIKIGIVGLSAKSTTFWAGGAHLPYILSARGSEKYQIVALLNSSVKSARQAIEKFSLPSSTRAYGSPDDLAADPDVQLVVVVTRVDKHYAAVLPSIKAGKDAFVEWPLAENLERVRELAAIASDKRVRTAVGLQGRLAPVIQKVGEVLASGQIGKVLHSEMRAAANREVQLLGMAYFTEKKVGGNMYTIGFAHIMDSIQFILGEVQESQVRFQLLRPDMKLRDPVTGDISTKKSDVPDLIILTGILPESATVNPGATLVVRYRTSAPFKGDPGFIWTVYGEKGELRLVSPAGPGLQANVYFEPVTIEVHDFETSEVKPIAWDWADYQQEYDLHGRSTVSLYEAYAAGDDSKIPTFDYALQRHVQLDSWLQTFV